MGVCRFVLWEISIKSKLPIYEGYFLGGTGTVTGSKTVLQTGTSTIMIGTDYFQGIKPSKLNWQPCVGFAATIDCVLLTHGHLDHCG
jgi:metallo-beta-lactamase family protein